MSLPKGLADVVSDFADVEGQDALVQQREIRRVEDRVADAGERHQNDQVGVGRGEAAEQDGSRDDRKAAEQDARHEAETALGWERKR